ncbi:3',5'-cyclic adenosine monophosphate phosphodiesterase CpdA [Enhygromyxa salina]|uniref:3',5'-cyclic adenosine monophosphate phosphodiesterase CpdA n=1 Tax=Enhygromyxa salina TaxID=215803 RepID=A0A2S9XDB6_9BACT|nr:metallophosphoesterase [Enhygromyxa salina]PRP90760.1 3',5'-cyclic adenosine monophosphate phosphodiesterase CpdA [Enhygromyxa salina]
MPVVLHFSDLHFGPHSRFAGQDPAEVGKRFFAQVREACVDKGLGEVELVVVTGDLTESARKQEFESARRFFEALVGELGLDRGRFCFVPGNHDVSWAHCKRVRINQEIEEFDDEELERRLHIEKMGPWNGFLADFYGAGEDPATRRSLGQGAFVHDHRDLRVSVAALDSCARETDRHHGGFIAEAQAQALMSEWRREGRRAWIKLLAVHHNPVADCEDNLREWVGWLGDQAEAKTLGKDAVLHFAADATGFEGRERLHAIAEDTQAQLVLHGHVHAAGHAPWSWRRGIKGQTQVVGAGSCGLLEHKLPGEQPVMFQLLVLDPAAHELNILRRVWEPRARAAGSVELGTFVDDPAIPRGGLVLDLGFPEGVMSPRPRPSSGPQVDRSFLGEYRMRLCGRHRIWELGAVHLGARRPATPALDDMYVPLRLGAHQELDEVKPGGEVITPYRLLQRHRNLLIRGAAGSGKTTWMRWSFRRLLEREDALPILIELRELARLWSQPGATGRQRNFDWWLGQWVERFVGGGWADALRAALTSKTGPRPVLMVDGWDELGDLGREFREQFDGFLAAHPRVLAIATSRPYGEQVPEHDDRFEAVEVQPLSDAEMGELVRLFFAKVYEGSEAEVAEEVERFVRALDAAEQAKSLGRTPLLLVMMLIIGRGRPLPDRRHKLYEFCIEQLLDAHPGKRVQDGAQVASWQWAPADFDSRLRAVAKLALWMHENRGSARAGRLAVAKREALAAQLPRAWSTSERHGFLAWLVASSGLMVDFSDEALSFAHLGFQEYLAAWQLEVDCEGAPARIELCRRLARDVSWWETLRLWSALVEGRSLARLEPVLVDLLEAGDVEYWLAGAIHADGVGAGVFDRWLELLPRAVLPLGEWSAATAAAAWRTSRQTERRARIAERLRGEVQDASWLDWWRLARWWRRAELDGYLNWPAEDTPAGIIVRTTEKLKVSREQVAWGRIWMASSPLWCGAQLPLLALRLWPNRRMWIACVLQDRLGSRGPVDLAELERWRWSRLRGRSVGAVLPDCTRRYVERVVEFGTVERELWLALEQARYVASFEVGNVTSVDRDRVRPVTLARELGDAHRAANALARDSANRAAQWGDCLFDEDLAGQSLGFVGVRTMFAQALDDEPLVRLLSKACRLSLANAAPDDELHVLCASFDGDPLWPALARHLARASSAEDRRLLEELAAHPERREGVVGLGLEYWVRGDVLLPDGSQRTLEQLGEALPLLDEVPLELDISELLDSAL